MTSRKESTLIVALWQKSESFEIYSIKCNIFEPAWMPMACLFYCALPIKFLTATIDFVFLLFICFFPNNCNLFGASDVKYLNNSFLLMHASFCNVLMVAVQIVFQIPLGYDFGNKRLI